MKRADWSREKAFRVDEDGCLIWRGTQHSSGYPVIRIDGETLMLKRALLSIIKGRPLKASERAISTCGKVSCCSCLAAVSHSRVSKLRIERDDYTQAHGRRLKISVKRQRRWTDDQIIDMRNRKTMGERAVDIAKAYDTDPRNLCHILNYRSHVLRLPSAVQLAMRTGAL